MILVKKLLSNRKLSVERMKDVLSAYFAGVAVGYAKGKTLGSMYEEDFAEVMEVSGFTWEEMLVAGTSAFVNHCVETCYGAVGKVIGEDDCGACLSSVTLPPSVSVEMLYESDMGFVIDNNMPEGAVAIYDNGEDGISLEEVIAESKIVQAAKSGLLNRGDDHAKH